MIRFVTTEGMRIGDHVFFADRSGRDTWGTIAKIKSELTLVVFAEGIHRLEVNVSEVTQVYR